MRTVSEQSRHLDTGVMLASFAGNVFSVCPNCAGPVRVTSQSKYSIPYVPKYGRAICLRCSFQRMDADGEWFGPVTEIAKRPCPKCGVKWLEQSVRRKTLKGKAADSPLVTCPSCGLVTRLSTESILERFGSAIDPTFGLPLWLQVPCCGATLWAYNGEHLNRLRQYVAAGLRERTANLKWSIFSRLPAWMTSAKNRDAVLAGIGRLEEKLKSIEG